MAVAAGHEGLAATLGHDLCPVGWLLAKPVEMGEFADMVHFDVVRLPAELASARQEPSDQLLGWVDRPGHEAVGEDRLLLPLEGNTSEPGHQGLLADTSDAGLEARSWPMRCVDLGLVTGRHLRHRRAVLAGQGLEHGGLHDPTQPVESKDITGKQVVLDEAPILGPELAHDVVVRLADHRGSVARLAA